MFTKNKRILIFLAVSLILGSIVGWLSYVSDIISTFKNDLNLFSFLLAYAAIMINSLPVWFIIAMFIGYIFGNNPKESSIFGMIFTVVANTFYLVISESLIELSKGVTITIGSQIKPYIFGWYLTSICGGAFGGIYRRTVEKIYLYFISSDSRTDFTVICEWKI
jgi:hypothetical protein